MTKTNEPEALLKEALNLLTKRLTKDLYEATPPTPLAPQDAQVRRQVLEAQEKLFLIRDRLTHGTDLLVNALADEKSDD